jgi:hypothetical protein
MIYSGCERDSRIFFQGESVLAMVQIIFFRFFIVSDKLLYTNLLTFRGIFR